MSDRWTLNRAGILNVYQYGDEVLHFGGGRLLLRGVNGSGKSTAMNMLLPFLLDADTRRIDAAGEQTGVLRSWMLNGRDEQQPVGYLWVEFERGGRHLVCGCGIRANRSTDNVTTWWFITSKRPGVDVELVEGRVPLSIDALRAALGPGEVFAKDQRQAYRAEVRSRLFGGADLDQHISLLHVVRSPRVGDRIDSDLPSYLNDALPQLSDTAIDDAAQPLEDLEEHRRNVAALETTTAALDALAHVYRSYARTELRRRATDASARVATVRSHRRNETAARHRNDAAQTALTEAADQVTQLEAAITRLTTEIAAMHETPAYQQGKRLDELRSQVATSKRTLTDAEHRLTASMRQRDLAATSAEAAQRVFASDVERLRQDLENLRLTASTTGVDVSVPDAPSVEAVPVDGVTRPNRLVDAEPIERGLAAVRAAFDDRRGDVVQVRQALDRVTRTETALRSAEQDRNRANDETEAADAARQVAVEALHASVEAFRDQLRQWVERVNADLSQFTTTPGFDPAGFATPDLLDRRTEIRADLDQTLTHTLRDLQAGAASLESRRHLEATEVARLQAELDELLARHEPEPPRTGWQRSSDSIRFSQVIDFADGVSTDAQLGLEAALEAAGILGAELGSDGFRLHSGDLIVTADRPVDSPLSDLVTVSIPAHAPDSVRADLVTGVLASISTDPNSPAATVVTADGSFRTGTLSGRHTKGVVEHVGASARAAALERRRAETRTQLDHARSTLARTEDEIAQQHRWIDGTENLRHALPSTSPVDRAQVRVEEAEATLARKQQLLDDATTKVEQADRTHGDAVDAARRVAATLRLPHTRTQLDELDDDLRDGAEQCNRTKAHINDVVTRSSSEWHNAASRWAAAVNEVSDAAEKQRLIAAEHEPLAMRLATLEDTVGAAHAEVLDAIALSTSERDAAQTALPAAKERLEHRREERATAAAAVATAQQQTAEAERHCVALLPRLRAALEVPGLRAALIDPPPHDEPTDHHPRPPAIEAPAVVESSEGVAQLAEFVLTTIPEPPSTTTAEGVRQSLRQRRDTLGAGWDAEDRQPDETLPLQIEVTGPLGRMPLADAATEVRQQLRQQAALLTANQDQALRNLLQGLIAKEVAEKLHAAQQLVARMNQRLGTVATSHRITASLRWRRRDGLDERLATTIDLMSKPSDLRTDDENRALSAALSALIEDARRAAPESSYRELIATVLDYRLWHEMTVLLHRPGSEPKPLSRRTALSEGEKKMVSYLPLFAAVAASCDALAEAEPAVPRFVLLDDAFAKVSEDNHGQLFGLLVDLDLDFIATSERLWGTHSTVPELAITEVIRDAGSGVIVLEHARWDGHVRTDA